MRERTLQHGGLTRYFLEYQSPDLAGKPAVVIDLHGGGQGMRPAFGRPDRAHQIWRLLARQHGFLLLAPNAVNNVTGDTAGDQQTWNDLRPVWGNIPAPDDSGFLAALIDWAIAERNADPKRIYMTGASNGGIMTYRMLIEHPEKIAAGVALIATLPAGGFIPMPAVARPLAIVNATEDRTLPWDGGRAAGKGQLMASTNDTVAFWLKAHGVEQGVGRTVYGQDRDPDDGCRVSFTSYGPTHHDTRVMLVAMQGAGHFIPSFIAPQATPHQLETMGRRCKDIDGPAFAWAFLRQHRLP